MYIDSHVHFRDFNQRHKETIRHGLEVAYDSGLDAVFDMPNTDPPLMTRELVVERLRIVKESGFAGKLHIAHISSPRAVDLTAEEKTRGMDISCGICPHHFIYDWSQMYDEKGLLWKMNPPLREPDSRNKIFQYLRDGKIDWIETDHAPHLLAEKTGTPYMSGIPGIAWWPIFEEYLRQQNFSDRQIEDLTFSNIVRRFGLGIQRSRRAVKDRRADYPFDPYQKMAKEVGW